MPMNIYQTNSPTRQAAIGGLAVVGFIALVAAGIWLAVYSTRYVPAVVNNVGTAAVYLGSLFTPSPAPSLSVVPTASTTISFGEANATNTPTSSPTTPSAKQTAPTAGPRTSGTYQISGTTATLSGLPDLTVKINVVGYLATASSDSFIEASSTPAGGRPAISFTVRNIGTNVSGAWRFSASIPTQTAFIYQSQPQQSLNPGDSIDYVLGFDQANRGTNQTISVTANFDRTVVESNTNNNSASTNIAVQ